MFKFLNYISEITWFFNFCVKNSIPLLISHELNTSIISSEVYGFYKSCNYIILDDNDICELNIIDNKINMIVDGKYNQYTYNHQSINRLNNNSYYLEEA